MLGVILPFLGPFFKLGLGLIGKIIERKIRKGELTLKARQVYLDFVDGIEDSLQDAARLRDQAKKQRDELK